MDFLANPILQEVRCWQLCNTLKLKVSHCSARTRLCDPTTSWSVYSAAISERSLLRKKGSEINIVYKVMEVAAYPLFLLN